MKWLKGALILCGMAVCLVGCQPGSSSGDEPSGTRSTTASTTATTVVETTYYTVKIPRSWESDGVYKITSGQEKGYLLSFYEKTDYEEREGGWLFSIGLFAPLEDYSVFPHYEFLGFLNMPENGTYNLVALYPTDVQFSLDSASRYAEMEKSVSAVLETLSGKGDYTISQPTGSLERWEQADS